jgi:hypothetical protein
MWSLINFGSRLPSLAWDKSELELKPERFRADIICWWDVSAFAMNECKGHVFDYSFYFFNDFSGAMLTEV